MSTMPQETSSALKIQLGRASRAPGRLWQVPTFLLGVLAFTAVAFTAPYRQDSNLLALENDMASLRRGLEPGAMPADALVARAENLLTRLPQFTRKTAEVHFLAGSAYYRMLDTAPPAQKPALKDRVINHLETAWASGVKSQDTYPLMYRLGVVLLQHGSEKDLRRATEFLAQSVEKGADSPARGYGILVEAYLKLPRPDLEAALAASQKQLELTDDRDAELMALARLTRADLLMRQENRQEALKDLERISAGISPATRVKARLLQARAYEDEGMWQRAVALWTELLPLENDVPGGRARILFDLGMAHASNEPPNLIEAMTAWQEAIKLGGDAGQAAALRLGEVQLFGPTPDADKALTTWHVALSPVRGERDFANPRVGVGQVRDWFDRAFTMFLEKQDFSRGEKLVELYKKLAAAGQAEERLAQAVEGRARDLQQAAKTMTGEDAKTAEAQYRAQYHRAAVAYEQAALVKQGLTQAGAFWQSAVCYLAAQDFSRAAGVLEKFVDLEKDEMKLAHGWLALAEANQAVGNKDQARQAYYKCIEYPTTPYAYRARYQLAVDELEKKNVDQARAILEQNLRTVSPTMDREAHEKSLYKMAGLLLQLQIFDKAALYLQEAWRQYPNNPSVLVAREQLAECYRKLAEQAQAKLAALPSEDARTHHQRMRRRWLEQAVETYQLLGDELEGMSRNQVLSPAELNVQRRALFGTADVLFDLEEGAEALRRYQILQARYRKKVEGLIACQRIWRCVGVISDPKVIPQVRTGATEAVQNALADLEDMPADSPAFGGAPGVWTKEDWTAWLRWVEGQLNGSPTAPRPKTLF